VAAPRLAVARPQAIPAHRLQDDTDPGQESCRRRDLRNTLLVSLDDLLARGFGSFFESGCLAAPGLRSLRMPAGTGFGNLRDLKGQGVPP